MKRILLFWVGAMFCVIVIGSSVPVHAQATKVRTPEVFDLPQAVVLSVLGRCEISTNGTEFLGLKVGHIVQQGAVLRTGADAHTDLFFRRIGTTVRLQADTEIKLEKLSRYVREGMAVMGTLLDLRKGRIFTVVSSLVPGSTFEIRNAAGRSVVEGGGGKGRYIITADGTHVTDKDSVVPLKVIGESGITIISPGQKFLAKEGKLLDLGTPEAVLMLINLDELQALAEELTPTLASKPKDDSQALVLSVGESSTFSQNGEPFHQLKVGQVLTQGAVIRSGEDAIVDLFMRRWGTTIRLVSGTELGLEKMTKEPGKQVPVMETRVHLRKGRVFCFIRIPVPSARFEVRTVLGRSLIESAGVGRYDISAEGTVVAGKSSFNHLKMITENGVKVIVPGQKFSAEDGFLTPTAPSEVELLVIQMDQLEALAEALAPRFRPEEIIRIP